MLRNSETIDMSSMIINFPGTIKNMYCVGKSNSAALVSYELAMGGENYDVSALVLCYKAIALHTSTFNPLLKGVSVVSHSKQ